MDKLSHQIMADQTNTPDSGTSETNVQDPKLNAAENAGDNKGAEGGKEEENRFNQEQVNKIVADRVKAVEKKFETKITDAVTAAIAETERKAKMSAEDKAQEEARTKGEALTKKEQEIILRENTLEAKEALVEAGIPQTLVGFVASVDPDKQVENIKVLVEEYTKAVAEGVKKALAGDKPKDFSDSKNSNSSGKKPEAKQYM